MSLTFLPALALLGPVLISTEPVLGGSDDCITPTPISGMGNFPFDLTTATAGTNGQNEPLCLSSGTTVVDNDVWFAWTPVADGCADIDTCSSTTLDTRIAIYDGSGCPLDGTALLCNDDGCSYQSEIQLPVTGGVTYTIQVGTFPGQTGTPGSLDITITPCPAPTVYAGNGHTYMLMDSALPWQQAKDAAEATTHQGIPGHLATINDNGEDVFVFYQLNNGVPLGNAWLGLYQDMSAPDYAEPAGGWRWVTGEPMTYTNWLAGEPNDGGAAEHFGGYFSGDQWNDYVGTDGAVTRWVVEWDTSLGNRYCFGNGSGTPCPCGNAGGNGEGCANSTGNGGKLFGTGTPSIDPDVLQFRGENLPPNQPSLLFAGLNATNNGDGFVFGDGLRCAGGGVVRLGVKMPDSGGVAIWGPDLAAQGGWGPGDLRRYQCWYRDPVGGSCGNDFNLTNGVEITFWP